MLPIETERLLIRPAPPRGHGEAALRVLAKLEFSPAGETSFEGRSYELFVLEPR